MKKVGIDFMLVIVFFYNLLIFIATESELILYMFTILYFASILIRKVKFNKGVIGLSFILLLPSVIKLPLLFLIALGMVLIHYSKITERLGISTDLFLNIFSRFIVITIVMFILILLLKVFLIYHKNPFFTKMIDIAAVIYLLVIIVVISLWFLFSTLSLPLQYLLKDHLRFNALFIFKILIYMIVVDSLPDITFSLISKGFFDTFRLGDYTYTELFQYFSSLHFFIPFNHTSQAIHNLSANEIYVMIYVYYITIRIIDITIISVLISTVSSKIRGYLK